MIPDIYDIRYIATFFFGELTALPDVAQNLSLGPTRPLSICSLSASVSVARTFQRRLDHVGRAASAPGHPHRSYQSHSWPYERPMRVYRAAGRSEAPGTDFVQHLEPGELSKKNVAIYIYISVICIIRYLRYQISVVPDICDITIQNILGSVTKSSFSL